jgi:hypothetical protein
MPAKNVQPLDESKNTNPTSNGRAYGSDYINSIAAQLESRFRK